MVHQQQMVQVFKVLSVEARVRIVELLKDRVLCVNALASQLKISPAGVSQHLRVLRDAGLVKAEKRGYYVHYCINHQTLERWRLLADGLLGGSGQ